MVCLILFPCNIFFWLTTYLVDRVRWFRARADMKRWKEEVTILREEFKRTYRTFMFLSNTWSKSGMGFPESRPGYRIYAQERASVYLEMAKRCRSEFKSIEGKELDVL